jgi:G3E family GTPase
MREPSQSMRAHAQFHDDIACEQVVFAERMVINKTDLVPTDTSHARSSCRTRRLPEMNAVRNALRPPHADSALKRRFDFDVPVVRSPDPWRRSTRTRSMHRSTPYRCSHSPRED